MNESPWHSICRLIFTGGEQNSLDRTEGVLTGATQRRRVMGTSESSRRRVSQGSLGDVSAEARVTSAKTAGSDSGGRVSNRSAASAAPRTEGAGGIRGLVVMADQQAIGGASVAISAGPPHQDIAAIT